ncbi:MAG: hypothetical protein AAGB31_09430, partial [Bdellovibrio sp.]
LLSLRRELSVWRMQQLFIDGLFENQGKQRIGVTQEELREAHRRYDISVLWNEKKWDIGDVSEQQALQAAWVDYGSFLESSWPVILSEQGRLQVRADLFTSQQSWLSLSQALLMRTLGRVLMLGYGESVSGLLSDSRSGITKESLIAWYDHFQGLGLDLGAFDPRSANSGARSFLEANFFTFSGNGNELMDHRETAEFVSTLVSGGLSSSEDLRRHMEKSGCALKEKDVFGKLYLEENCFREQFKKSFSVLFNNLPGMTQYVKSLGVVEWAKFFHYIKIASQVPGQKKGVVETAHLRTMVMILHYVETVMVLYDGNRDQALSLEEVYAAAPRFLSFFRSLKPDQPAVILKEGFAYLVFNGKIPGASDLVVFQWDKLTGLVGAQRMELIRLFGTLKEQLNNVQN